METKTVKDIYATLNTLSILDWRALVTEPDVFLQRQTKEWLDARVYMERVRTQHTFQYKITMPKHWLNRHLTGLPGLSVNEPLSTEPTLHLTPRIEGDIFSLYPAEGLAISAITQFLPVKRKKVKYVFWIWDARESHLPPLTKDRNLALIMLLAALKDGKAARSDVLDMPSMFAPLHEDWEKTCLDVIGETEVHVFYKDGPGIILTPQLLSLFSRPAPVVFHPQLSARMHLALLLAQKMLLSLFTASPEESRDVVCPWYTASEDGRPIEESGTNLRRCGDDAISVGRARKRVRKRQKLSQRPDDGPGSDNETRA